MPIAFDFEAHRKTAVTAYSSVRAQYEGFCVAIESILRTALTEHRTHLIATRAKSIESFANKAAKPSQEDPTLPKYSAPLEQITDLAGIRIIVYDLASGPIVEAVVDSLFERVDRSDKGERLLELGTVGYRSIHNIVKLKPDRRDLLEYRAYSSLVAEIQIRTILQHAWAEIEHDIRYKSEMQPHKELSQRFMALAGLIEIGDREFSDIYRIDSDRKKKVRELVQINEHPLDEKTEANAEADLASVFEPRQEPIAIDGQVAKSLISPKELIAERRYSEAIAAYNKLILGEPIQFSHFLGRAKARFLNGDASGALDDLNEAESRSPGNRLVFRIRALITGVNPQEIERGQEGHGQNELDLADGRPRIEEQASNQGREEKTGTYSARQDFGDYRAALRQGHDALQAGDYERANERYEQARQLGFSPVYSIFNIAMVRCLEKLYGLCLVTLARLEPFPGSILEFNILVLKAICYILQDGDVSKVLPPIIKHRMRLTETMGYTYDRSALRILEAGLKAADIERYNRVLGVFKLLEVHAPNHRDGAIMSEDDR